MLRWKSSLKPAAAAPSDDNPGTTNLVAWLGMDEGSGTSVDDSTSNNNDFTLTNGTWVGSGKVGSNAVRLDGTGDYISSDAAFAVGANVCTVSFWMDWTDSGADEKFIYELGNRWWQTDGSIALSWVVGESVFKAAMHDGSGNLEVKFPEPSSSQWVYVTVVYNGSANTNAGEIKLYYNGTAQSGTVATNTKNQASNIPSSSSTFYIGANSVNTQEITIDLDTFAIFSDELTSAEITWLYNSGSGRSYSALSGGGTSYKDTVLADNPLFYYRLGEASGDTSGNMYDEVATSNNGTYYNTPTLGQTGAISGDSNTSVKFEEANAEYADTVTLSSETSLLPCTIECFIKTDGASDSNAGIVFIRGSVPASGLNMYGASTSVRRLGYHWNNGSATYGFSSGPTFADNTWYYVALVIESTKATFYMIDESGTLTTPAVKTTTHAAIDVSSNGWTIGRDAFGSNRSFQGWVDEVAIYDQAFSQSKVVAHAAAAGFASSTYLIEENFEGTGTPTSWSSTGTVDYDSTPPASSPNGGEVMEISDNSNYAEFSTTGANLYFQFRLDTLPYAANDWVGLLDASGSILAGIVIQTDGGVRLQMDNTYSTMSDTISINQWYHARLVYVSGGPSTLEINTTGTFSGDGTDYVEHTDSDATAAVATARIRGPRGGVRTGYYDRVISSSNTIGNSP